MKRKVISRYNIKKAGRGSWHGIAFEYQFLKDDHRPKAYVTYKKGNERVYPIEDLDFIKLALDVSSLNFNSMAVKIARENIGDFNEYNHWIGLYYLFGKGIVDSGPKKLTKILKMYSGYRRVEKISNLAEELGYPNFKKYILRNSRAKKIIPKGILNKLK